MIPGLIAHLWQSTLFAGAAWLLAFTLRKNQARVRYGIWFIASAKFLTPFSLLVGLGALVPRRAAVPAIQSTWIAVAEQVTQPLADVPAVVAQVTVNAAGAHPNYFEAAAIGLWVCGFFAIASCWLLRWKRVHALRKAATPVRIPNAMEFAVPVMSAPGLVEPA
jgi:bla regulator protein BlaR1